MVLGDVFDWEQKKLEELLQTKIINGITNIPGKNKFNIKDINVVNLYTEDYINVDKLKYINISEKEYQKYKAVKGDIFITRSSLKADGIAQANILLDSSSRYVFDDHIMKLSFNPHLNHYFVSQLLSTQYVRNQFKAKAKTGSMTTIGHSDIENTYLIIPNQKEQTKISGIIITINNTIKTQQRKLDQLKLLKKGLLQKMFADEDSKVPEIKLINESNIWEIYQLGDLGFTKSGIGFPEIEQGGKTGIPFFKISDMNSTENQIKMTVSSNYVTKEQIKSKNWKPITKLPAIIFAKVGAAIFLNRKRIVEQPFLIDNNTMAYIFNKNYWNINFGKALFDTLNLPKYVRVGALPSYNDSDIKSIIILLPSKEIQKKIGTTLKKYDFQIQKEQHKLNQLQQIKKFLLQNMFI